MQRRIEHLRDPPGRRGGGVGRPRVAGERRRVLEAGAGVFEPAHEPEGMSLASYAEMHATLRPELVVAGEVLARPGRRGVDVLVADGWLGGRRLPRRFSR